MNRKELACIQPRLKSTTFPYKNNTLNLNVAFSGRNIRPPLSDPTILIQSSNRQGAATQSSIVFPEPVFLAASFCCSPCRFFSCVTELVGGVISSRTGAVRIVRASRVQLFDAWMHPCRSSAGMLWRKLLLVVSCVLRFLVGTDVPSFRC